MTNASVVVVGNGNICHERSCRPNVLPRPRGSLHPSRVGGSDSVTIYWNNVSKPRTMINTLLYHKQT